MDANDYYCDSSCNAVAAYISVGVTLFNLNNVCIFVCSDSYVQYSNLLTNGNFEVYCGISCFGMAGTL